MTAATEAPVAKIEHHIRPRTGWVAVDWRELWENRELLLTLVRRDLSVRYKQTVLGGIWALVQPVATMVIFSLLFGRVARLPSDGLPYPVFVYAGLLPWMFFSNAITSSGQSLLNQQNLLTKIYLPRLFVPIAPIGSLLLDFCIALLVLFALMLYYGVGGGVSILLLPALMFLAAITSLGIGLLLAPLVITYRDFRYVIPFAVQLWMYVSPVIYPTSAIPEKYQWIIGLNPMTGVIEAFRAALLGTPWRLDSLVLSIVISLVLLLAGLFYFRRCERRFADIA